MTKKYNTIVLVGRFQPLHKAHVEIIRRASNLAEVVHIIVGSSYLPRTYKNPFTFAERSDMIVKECKVLGMNRGVDYLISPIMDYNNDQIWAAKIQEIVDTFPDERTAMIGHKKDSSSFYLDMFPQWELIELDPIEPLNATDIRDLYFRDNANMSYLTNIVPEEVLDFLYDFAETEDYFQVIREKKYIQDYKLQYQHLPYEPVFVTADAVVFQSGHVLLVKRRAEPGKGLWALPGGFLNASTDRSVQDAAIRELKEETNIKVPEKVLIGSIKGNKVFDAVNRSARGRTITHAFNIVLPEGELPKVKGMDDAEKAVWMPLSHVVPDRLFEDHYQIIHSFL